MCLVGCRQERGKTTRSQECMGLESKASPEVSAREGALLNPQKWLSSWFLALQHMGFPGPVRRWEHPKGQLGLAIKGTGSGQP